MQIDRKGRRQNRQPVKNVSAAKHDDLHFDAGKHEVEQHFASKAWNEQNKTLKYLVLLTWQQDFGKVSAVCNSRKTDFKWLKTLDYVRVEFAKFFIIVKVENAEKFGQPVLTVPVFVLLFFVKRS